LPILGVVNARLLIAGGLLDQQGKTRISLQRLERWLAVDAFRLSKALLDGFRQGVKSHVLLSQ